MSGGWPRSLVGRHLLLMAVLVVAGQLCAAALARHLIFEPRIALAAEGVVRNAEALQAGLRRLPPAQREAFVAAFNQAAARAPSAGEGGPPRQAGTRLAPMERRFLQAVSARMGAGATGGAPAWRRDSTGVLAVRIAQDGSDYWLNLPSLFPARVFTGTWLAATLAGVLLALAGALWLQRQIHRPLARVVAAADRIGRGAPHEAALPEDGPTEIATVARSINHMARALADSERERAVMLAGISHDLRTPLTKLQLAVEIAAPRMEPELAAGMARSIATMDGLVGQFLDFARWGAGGDEAEPWMHEPLDVLAEAVAQAQADHGRRVALALAAPAAVPLRAQALRRAVDNLVENAFRHGRPPVQLRTGHDAGRDEAWIEVADDGPGLPGTADAEHLRRPFVRGGGAAREGPPGAGLGLAIADRVARAHGGRLELATPPNGGLQARIVLPATAG